LKGISSGVVSTCIFIAKVLGEILLNIG